MILARPVSLERDDELASTLARLGLPAGPSSLAHRAVLVTGLDAEAQAVLARACREVSAGSDASAGEIAYLAGAASRPGTALVRASRPALLALGAALEVVGAVLLAGALQNVERAAAAPAPTRLGDRPFTWGTRTFVMGVLNVTPDSFSDGGRHATLDAALAHAAAMVEAGADVIDVGGESTRPGAEGVSLEEERRRVLPVVEALRARLPGVPVSVDTSKAALAKAALAAGAAMINDVTGLKDAALVEAVAVGGAAVCAMHMQGAPRTMQQAPAYDDVVGEVLEALAGAVTRATAAGVPRHQVLVDPGIGFGKTFGHNLFLLRHLAELRVLGVPVLVGTSRKAFLGQLTGGLPAAQRVVASAASAAVLAVLNGADLVRVHDVAQTKQALAVADAVARAEEGGSLFDRSRDGAPTV